MKAHYATIWAGFREGLHVDRFVSDDETLAIRGETFDYRGVILYHLAADGRFQQIQVAYNSFTHTTLDGTVIEMGIPH